MKEFLTEKLAQAICDNEVASIGESSGGYIAYDDRERLSDVDIAQLIAGMTREQVISRCMLDLNFLAKFFLPHVCKLDFPELLDSVWRLWIDGATHLIKYRGEFKAATAIPRGYSKTTLLKLYITWLILYTPHTFIVIIGSTDANAEAISTDIIDMLSQPHVRAVFGNWDSDVRTNSKELRAFRFLGKQIVLKPKGALTSVRGLNIFNRRPDAIIIDDVETAEVAASPAESAKLTEWMFNTLVPTINADGGLIMFVGNVYPHPTSLLHIIKRMQSWTKLILGAILTDGSALWEELHSKKKTLQAYLDAVEQGTTRAWLAQYMNAVEDETLNQADLTAIAKYGQDVEKKIAALQPDLQYIIVDPATDKRDADNTCILQVQVFGKLIVCRRAVLRVLSPKETIRVALQMATDHCVPAIFIEDVNYQYTLGQWLDDALKALSLQDVISVYYIAPKRSAKNARINLSFKELNSAEVIIHPELYPRYRAEAKSFDPARRDNNDNLLDTVHYASIIHDKYKLVLAAKQRHYYLSVLEKSSRVRAGKEEKLECPI